MRDLILDVWHSLEPFHEIVTAILITLVSAFLLWLFRARVKLIWGSTSANYHSFAINEHNKVSIWTEKFFVQNSGRKAASKIEIVFSDSLTSYNLWTPRDHKSKRSDNGNFVIQVPSLAPGELLIVDVIDVDMRSPKLLTVNCPDALSEEVQFAAMRQFGWLMQSLIVYLILAGFLGSVYLVLKILMGGK